MKVSLRALLVGLTSIAIVVVTLGGLALNLQGRIEATEFRLVARSNDLTAAAAPLLLNALVVGDLAMAEQILRNLNLDRAWDKVTLYEADGRTVMLDVSPSRSARPDAPSWVRRVLPLDLREHRVEIAAAPVVYGTLAVTPSSASLEGELWREASTTIIATVVLLVVLLVLINLILSRGLRPIRFLAASAARFGGGDLSVRMPETTLSEVAPTVRAFNAMASNLEQVMADLRAKEAANRRLAAIVEQSEEAILTIDLEQRIRSWNLGASRLFGRTAEEVIGDPISSLFSGRPPAEVQAEIARLIDTPGRRELVLRPGPEALFAVGASASPLHDEHGAQTGHIIVARDITERRRAEEARTELEQQLRQAQKMEAVGRLAGGIAHDFNNLLAVVMGRSDLLLRRLGTDAQLQRHVQLIRETAGRAADLTQQLLAFSRKQVLKPRVVDPNAALTALQPMLRRLIGEDIEVVITLGSALGCIRVDPGQLDQVFLNLAVNARDAMPQGGRLTFRTLNVDLDDFFVRRHPGARPGPHVRLVVSDTGVGMDAETQAHLFEPFFTTKGPGKGTGLGLATVYGVIKQSGGHIVVESAPEQGATFVIHFPRVDEAVPVIEREQVPEELPGGSETVLLVEDEEAVRALANEILATSGYTVLQACHGAEALDLADRHQSRIDLLLTDVVMPGIGGRELVERLGPRRPDMRVLYMSGYTADALGKHGVLEADTALLAKPFTPDILMKKVREVLDGADAAAGHTNVHARRLVPSG
jgi:PAS domain S-box-containing protein